MIVRQLRLRRINQAELEDKLLGEAVDEKSTDNIYLNEVLPAKMRYNLESIDRKSVV